MAFSMLLAAFCGCQAGGILPADSLVAYDLGKGLVASSRFHLRVVPAKAADTRLRFYWNYADPSSFRCIEISVPGVGKDDPLLGFSAAYKVFYGDSVVEQGSVAGHYPSGSGKGFSVIFNTLGNSGLIELGSDKVGGGIDVDFCSSNPGSIAYESSRRVEIKRNELYTDFIDPLPSPRFTRVEEIEDYLLLSNDSIEGLWRYLDRDTDAAKVRMSKRYALATVSTGNGYEIISINPDGTAEYKGNMTPTVFEDHFDLVWHDANGRRLDDENSATLSDSRFILRLDFPLLKSTLRFSRQK